MIHRRLREIVFSDLGILILLALSRIILHALTNQQYGFHRDELGTLDDARHLAWGYVAYPLPLDPFHKGLLISLTAKSAWTIHQPTTSSCDC
jgi:hypothetical protein